MSEFSSRYVALGDSFTEGVGDIDPTRPNQVRGWADRLALMLSQDPSVLAEGLSQPLGYANLALRGRKIRGILAEQISPAIALKPDLVTIYAGANDILRPKVDIDDLVQAYGEAIGALRATGARVLVFTGFDARSSKVFGAMRGRTAIYNEQVRGVVDTHGAEIIDYWRFAEYNDWRLWGEDRMHMSSRGHRNMAERVFHHLTGKQRPDAAPGPFLPEELPPAPVLPRLEAARSNYEWTRDEAVPWIRRRITGTSSGDRFSARYPQLVDAATLA